MERAVGTLVFSLHITSLRDVWRKESPIIYRYDVPKRDKRQLPILPITPNIRVYLEISDISCMFAVEQAEEFLFNMEKFKNK